MVPGGRQLIDVGYKYKEQKVVYFIVTEDTGSTKSDITYFYNYTYQFYNVAIHPVLVPLSCISSLGVLMRLTPTKTQVILIYQ